MRIFEFLLLVFLVDILIIVNGGIVFLACAAWAGWKEAKRMDMIINMEDTA